MERLAHLGRELEEAGILACRLRSRLRQVDGDHPGDPAGPRRHHDDPRREKDRLGDRVRDEDDRRAAGLPDAEQLCVQALAGHLVERAERLVHKEQSGREGQRAGDCDTLLHAARELPRMVLPEPLKLDELEHLVDARLPLRSVPAGELERQRDVLRHRPPLVEHGVLEDDAVVVVAPRLTGRLAVHLDVAARRLDQVADDPQQRRLAAPRRADERDELAVLDLELDVLERRRPALEPLRDAVDRDRAHATCSGARRTTIFSAPTTARKKAMPSSAAMMFVAHRFCGWNV